MSGCLCGDPCCPECSVHYEAARASRRWSVDMLSKPKARAILWLFRAPVPPTIDEWSRRTHEGTSAALRHSNLIRACAGGTVELTILGLGIAYGLAFALRNHHELAELEQPPEVRSNP